MSQAKSSSSFVLVLVLEGRRWFATWHALLLAPSLLFAVGCSTFVSSRSQKQGLLAQYQAGNFAQAAAIATERAEARKDTGDELMWRLEEGSTRLAAGDADGSLAAFERAEAIIADHERRAVISAREAAAESGAALTNPNVIPYPGNYAEKILLNTGKALGYLFRGDIGGARVELRRADERQREAREHYAREIERAETQARERQFTAAEMMAGSPELQQLGPELDGTAGKVFGDYVNPFTTYLSAFTYLWQGNPGEALVDFRNLHRMMPDHPQVRRDYATGAAALGQAPPELAEVRPWPYPLHDRICLIVVEHGLAPARREIRIHLPLPPPVGYTGVAFPVPEHFPRGPCAVVVSAPATGATVTPWPIADLDGIFARAYRMELPVMITRLAVAVTIKESANLAAMYAVRDQPLAVQIGALLLTSLYRFATNRADVRSWQCLPGEYQVGHLPLPDDGRLEVDGQAVTLPPGTRRALLWIKTVPGGPPVVRACALK